MAKLALYFKTEEGGSLSFFFPYADPQVEESAVQALMNVMITNGSVFETSPIAPLRAYVIPDITNREIRFY